MLLSGISALVLVAVVTVGVSVARQRSHSSSGADCGPATSDMKSIRAGLDTWEAKVTADAPSQSLDISDPAARAQYQSQSQQYLDDYETYKSFAGSFVAHVDQFPGCFSAADRRRAALLKARTLHE